MSRNIDSFPNINLNIYFFPPMSNLSMTTITTTTTTTTIDRQSNCYLCIVYRRERNTSRIYHANHCHLRTISRVNLPRTNIRRGLRIIGRQAANNEQHRSNCFPINRWREWSNQQLNRGLICGSRIDRLCLSFLFFSEGTRGNKETEELVGR